MIQQPEQLPKLRKLVKPKEEPKKEEPKRTKVKIPKVKKYEDLPEIPDYERPDLEVYEESAFDPSKLEKSVPTALQKQEAPAISEPAQLAEPAKNGLPKVSGSVVVVFFITNIPQNTFCDNFDWTHAHKSIWIEFNENSENRVERGSSSWSWGQ